MCKDPTAIEHFWLMQKLGNLGTKWNWYFMFSCSASLSVQKPKMFNGSRIFAHSLVIVSIRGSGGGSPSGWRYGEFIGKIIHF